MNAITIFDKLTGAFKADAVYSDISLKADLTTLVTSSLKIPIINIEKQDIIVLFYQGVRVTGKILDIVEELSYLTISFVFGNLLHQVDTFLPGRTNSLTNYTENNRSPLEIVLNDTVTILASDKSLKSWQIINQAMRKKQYTCNFSSFKCSVIPNPAPPIKIRLDDPIYKYSHIYRIANDSLNELQLVHINKETDKILTKVFFLGKSGQILEEHNPILTDTPTVNAIEKVEDMEDLSKEYATSWFREKEYNNEIEITLSVQNELFPFSTELLSRNIEIYGKAQLIKTNVTAYEIINNKMRLVFGLSRTRLTQLIGGK